VSEFEVIGAPLTEVEIGATGLRAIAQNVKTIITTWRGSVFLDRAFGIDSNMVDMPVNVLHARLAQDITVTVQKYEPRVEITSVTFDSSNATDGQIVPIVRYKIKEGVLL